MRPLPNFDFNSITSFPKAIEAIEKQVLLLQELVGELDQLTGEDRAQFVRNIEWLKGYYEAAERCLLEEQA